LRGHPGSELGFPAPHLLGGLPCRIELCALRCLSLFALLWIA
jgi:hypothetical protein